MGKDFPLLCARGWKSSMGKDFPLPCGGLGMALSPGGGSDLVAPWWYFLPEAVVVVVVVDKDDNVVDEDDEDDEDDRTDPKASFNSSLDSFGFGILAAAAAARASCSPIARATEQLSSQYNPYTLARALLSISISTRRSRSSCSSCCCRSATPLGSRSPSRRCSQCLRRCRRCSFRSCSRRLFFCSSWYNKTARVASNRRLLLTIRPSGVRHSTPRAQNLS
mmetsp:Transcript_8527/g.16452  ORF Transcript_8527/g.16452 Transcript_8527/m.16452 type:complete len:221 (+) Transcript_8527:2-664(+)